MPRRFALALLLTLVLLLTGLFVVSRARSRRPDPEAERPRPRPTTVVPPTPIPARRVALYFESAEDEKLHPEARDLPESSDAVAFLRSLAAAVVEGPRRPDLLRPFPEGWTLRAAFRLAGGVAVLDLGPPEPAQPQVLGGGALRWSTGSHEEETAAQALLVTVARGFPDITRVVLLVGGEPVETLAGHLDLTHPLRPDIARAVDEPAGDPPPTFTPIPSSSPASASTPTTAAKDSGPAANQGVAATPPPPRPTRVPSPSPSPRVRDRTPGESA